MISIVIPVIDALEITYACVHKIYAKTYNVPEVIIIDNASEIPYIPYLQEIVIRNEENAGLFQSLKQGIERASNEVVLFMHNDVLIHELDWDLRTESFFQKVPDLAMAGFFGARGVHPNGARECSESQMLGKEWGDSWCGKDGRGGHSNYMPGFAPAATFDGVALLFRKSLYKQLGFPELPPHHWYDRILPLWYIDKGYKCGTVGIAFDHGPGAGMQKVSAGQGYSTYAKNWCNERGIEPPYENAWDHAIYNVGSELFIREWSHRLPLRVNSNWEYEWNSKTLIDA